MPNGVIVHCVYSVEGTLLCLQAIARGNPPARVYGW